MRRIYILFLSVLMISLFSFDIIQAKASTDGADKLMQIKEIRQSIKNQLKANDKIEKQIDRKSKQIEKILVKLPKNSVVPQRAIDEELSPKLEGIMSQLMQIGEYESASWKNLKKANNLISAKKYEAGINYLRLAEADLKNKHDKMIDFESDLDLFLTFISSLQHK